MEESNEETSHNSQDVKTSSSPSSSSSSSSLSSTSSLSSKLSNRQIKTNLCPEAEDGGGSKEENEEKVIQRTLAILDADYDDQSKVEIYEYLLDNVFEKYLKVSNKERPSMRFKLLLSMLIIGSQRSRLFLIALHYISEWQWIKSTEPFYDIIFQLLRHYLLSVLLFNIDIHINNLSRCKASLSNVINEVLSKTLLSTFNDKLFHDSIESLKSLLTQIIASENPILMITEIDDLLIFSSNFDIWSKRIFNDVSTNTQYCYDFEKLSEEQALIYKISSEDVQSDSTDRYNDKVALKATPQIVKALDVIYEEEENVVDYSMAMDMEDMFVETSNTYSNIYQHSVKSKSKVLQIKRVNTEMQAMVGHEETKNDPLYDDQVAYKKQQSIVNRLAAYFRNIPIFMDEDDDSSYSSS